MSSLNKYRHIIFDCDGVILNSNAIKQNAFIELAAKYLQPNEMEEFIEFSKKNPTSTRFERLGFLKSLSQAPELSVLVEEFSDLVEEKLIHCEMSEKLPEFRMLTSYATWSVVSGSEQTQLKRILKTRGIDHLFDGGIFGSPLSKSSIIHKFELGSHKNFTLSLGDSQRDFEIAREFKSDFIFISGWAAPNSWPNPSLRSRVRNYKSLDSMFFQNQFSK